MTKFTVIKFAIIFLFITPAFAQKVKYKDIWGLLSTKQYEPAEPFLKKYIKDNTDNPNAYLNMGIIFHEKSGKDDVLKQTKRAIADMDSAIFFYDKAYKTITEKEIKRNDEYYQAYNRRDLRTGEFGVKLSDIQFDLEKKIEGLRERIDRVKMSKYFLVLSDSLYKKSNALFMSIQSRYPGEKEFYLRADSAVLKDLTKLSIRFDSCLKAFDNYKSCVVTLGKIGYNQTMTKNEIRDFGKDGSSQADFYNNDLQVWDYKSFATKSKQIIEKEIIPMRSNLIDYDIAINKLREKLNRDSVSVKSDLTRIVDKLLMDQLKKYDEDPLPMNVFSLKIADLEYRSSLIEHKKLKDSTDLYYQISNINEELKGINKIDSLSSRLLTSNLDKSVEDYPSFITNTYSNATVLKSFVRTLKDYAEREKELTQKSLMAKTQSLRWIVNGTDSIPLFFEAKSKFRPLQVVDEKYTTGLVYADSLSPAGYFYSITRSRKPDIKISFPVDKTNFKESLLPLTKALVLADASGQIYFSVVYSERPLKDKRYPVTVAKIYKSDGLAWSVNYALPFIPKEIAFNPVTGELTIIADSQQSIIDKNGKLMK